MFLSVINNGGKNLLVKLVGFTRSDYHGHHSYWPLLDSAIHRINQYPEDVLAKPIALSTR